VARLYAADAAEDAPVSDWFTRFRAPAASIPELHLFAREDDAL
jgi:hypothetical protein